MAAVPLGFLIDEGKPVAPNMTESPAPARTAGERPGTDEARAACSDLGIFFDSLGERDPLDVELEVVMGKFAPQMDAAAAKDPHWAAAAAAAREMARLMGEAGSTDVKAQVDEQARVIDTICGPLAWSN